jgi:hypothetical protein
MSDLPPFVPGELNKVTTRSVLIGRSRTEGGAKSFSASSDMIALKPFDPSECFFALDLHKLIKAT